MTSTTRAARLAVCATVVTAVVGCSADDSDPTVTPSTSVAEAFGWGGNEVSDGDREGEAQRLIVDCMTALGWDYTPVMPADQPAEWSSELERERIAEQGFGIVFETLNPGRNSEDGWGAFADPNARYRTSLTEAQLSDYYDDLYGSETEWAETDHDSSEFGLGCEGHAYGTVYGDDAEDDLMSVMLAFSDEVQVKVDADPRIVAQEREWSQCMRDAGFPYGDRDELWGSGYSEMYARYDAVTADVSWVDPMDGWSPEQVDQFWDTATAAEIDALFAAGHFDLSDRQRADLQALLDDEIALALADHDCSIGHGDLYQAVYAEIEAQFVRDNEERIDQAITNATADRNQRASE